MKSGSPCHGGRERPAGRLWSLVLAALLALEAYAGSAGPGPSRADSLRRVCAQANSAGRSHQAVEAARQLLRASAGAPAPRDSVYALIVEGNHLLRLDSFRQGERAIRRALDLSVAHGLDWGVSQAYSALGCQAMAQRGDFGRGIRLLHQGLLHAARRGDDDGRALLSANLAVAYTLCADTAGLRYARFVADYGNRANDPYYRYTGGLTMASLLLLRGRLEQAMEAINVALPLAHKYYDSADAYTIKADILREQGRPREALACYREASRRLDQAETASKTRYYLGYGTYLIGQDDCPGAIEALEKGLELTGPGGNKAFLYHLHQALSRAYAGQGDHARALAHYRAGQAEGDTLLALERERSLAEMKVKYQTQLVEIEVAQKEQQIRRQSRALWALAGGGGALAALLLTIIWLYRRQGALYRSLVRQNNQALRRETLLQQRIQQLEEGPNGKEPPGEGDQDQWRPLFRRIEGLMARDELFRQKGLTKEALAEAAHSNAAYVSRAVNQGAGMSLTAYINRHRVNRAIALMNTPEGASTPLKIIADEAGFNSASVFFRVFKEQTGLSPAQYRRNLPRGE